MADFDRELALTTSASLLRQHGDPAQLFAAQVLDLCAKALQVTRHISDDGAECTSAYGAVWEYLRRGIP